MWGEGLTGVRTTDLERALRMHVRGELDLPVTIIGFARVGLQHCAGPLLDALRGLDAAGVRAVLVVALAERRAVAARPQGG